jgi:hypothetical protein
MATSTVNDTFSSQRQSNSTAVTKSSNVHDRDESKHTSATTTTTTVTTATSSGHEADSGVFGDFINLKIAAASRQTFISVR